ncbi:MAG: hypothetical protein WBP16_12170 [Ferruginibacter sp.]
MKKIFTLLFATAMLSTAFAQYGQKGQRQGNKQNDVYASNGNHGYDKPGKGYNDWYVFTPRERDIQIGQINQEYDYKINRVKHQFLMGWFQQKRQIMLLEKQRDNEIQAVNQKFNDRKNRFGDFGRVNKGRW